MNETTALAAPAETPQTTAPAAFAAQTALSIFSTATAFEQAQRAAKLLAASDLLPTAFRNNVPNCVVAMEMANRLGASPFAVFQSLYVVHGRPSWASTFLIGMVNASGKFTPLQFRVEGTGDNMSCVAWARSKETGEVVEGPPVTIAMAKAEGWLQRQGSKWLTMPQVMLRYRAASFFAKLYAPEITLGMQTAEEVYDMEPAVRNVSRPDSFSKALAEGVGVAVPPATVTFSTPAPAVPATVEPVAQAPAKVEAAEPKPKAAAKPLPDTAEPVRAWVEKLSCKAGTKNGKDWKAWFLTYSTGGDQQPKECVTFDPKVGELLDTLDDGAEIMLAVKPNAKGRGDQIVSVEVVEAYEAEPEGSSDFVNNQREEGDLF